MQVLKQEQDLSIIQVPVSDFRISMVDKKKKECGKNYCNAGFFAGYNEGKDYFTLPIGHLICDYNTDNKWVKKYCTERGKFLSNDKFLFDCSKFSYQNPLYQNSVSTLIIENGKARINEIKECKQSFEYAISGVPVIRDGKNVDFKTFVKKQGWDSSTLYATRHIFVALKKNVQDIVYIICMKTTKSNLISSNEVFDKLKSYNFYDMIKLDGGGSTYIDFSGKTISTNENRQINSIIRFDEIKTITQHENNKINNQEKCPYTEPKLVVKKGSKGNDVKWVQWYLNKLGYQGKDSKDIQIDGNAGNNTVYALTQFQKNYWKKDASKWDGKCGQMTRVALKNSYIIL